MIDNTFASPFLCNPLEHGADIVMHSATKFIGGHGLAITGVLVDAGRFDWRASCKFPTLTEPYAGYHGIDFAAEFGPHVFIMRARTEGLRDFGPALSPQNAFYLLEGLETLPLRMRQHVAAHARWRDSSWAIQPSSACSIPTCRAIRTTNWRRCCCRAAAVRSSPSILRAAARRASASSSGCSHLANVGDAKSLVIHPASTTHARLTAEQLAVTGIGKGMVRLSVGLEDDLPGHGRYGGTPLAGIPAMADWTMRLLDAAGVRLAALVGHSMGGLVVLDAAGRYPDRVRALGLCGIAGEMPVHPEMLGSAKAGTAKCVS